MPDITISGNVDWAKLSAQKHELVKIAWNPADHPVARVAAAEGLLNFVDHVQDRASTQGHPVVLLTPVEEEKLMNDMLKPVSREDAAQLLEAAAAAIRDGKASQGGYHFIRNGDGYRVAGYVRVDP